MDKIFPYDSVELSEDGKELIILDQSVLPNAEVFLRLTSAEEIFFSITLLKVRGAPAIGIAAALGLAMCMIIIPLRLRIRLFCQILQGKVFLPELSTK